MLLKGPCVAEAKPFTLLKFNVFRCQLLDVQHFHLDLDLCARQLRPSRPSRNCGVEPTSWSGNGQSQGAQLFTTFTTLDSS